MDIVHVGSDDSAKQSVVCFILDGVGWFCLQPLAWSDEQHCSRARSTAECELNHAGTQYVSHITVAWKCPAMTIAQCA